MKAVFILFGMFICFSSISLQAQLTITHMDIGINEIGGQANKHHLTSGGSSEISGSPYLDENFEDSNIFYDEKYRITKVPIRYNIYADQIEYKSSNIILSFANPEKIDSIVSESEVFIYLQKNEHHKVRGFAKLWNDEYPSILTKMKVEFFNKEKAQAFAEARPARFERAMDRHYLMENEDEIEIIGSVKKLIKSLGNHTSELSDFAKKEKVSASDAAELAKLLDYYHGLNKE